MYQSEFQSQRWQQDQEGLEQHQDRVTGAPGLPEATSHVGTCPPMSAPPVVYWCSCVLGQGHEPWSQLAASGDTDNDSDSTPLPPPPPVYWAYSMGWIWAGCFMNILFNSYSSAEK